MCGIWLLLSTEKIDLELKDIHSYFNNIIGRGPDFSMLKKIESKYNLFLGFHRLSINGLTALGNQPFERDTIDKKYYLVCNGEIYNYMELANKHNIKLNGKSDCEVLLPLYLKLGLKNMVDLLDGVFSIIIITINKKTNEILIESSRDRIGVRPLFYGKIGDKTICLSSEMKGIHDLSHEVNVFKPGNNMNIVVNNDKIEYKFNEYYDFVYKEKLLENREEDALSLIRIYFENAIKKRLMSDRPIGSLLSGGLDSSLVSALVSKFLRNNKVNTFSISMPGGTDIKYAMMVSEHIKSTHHNLELSKDEFLEAIEDTIYAIESYDITTVRASVGQYLISKYISKNTNIKVIMSGDGSDELCSGYIYNYNAPSVEALHEEASKRLKEIHLYDGLRADRATSYHGLELRVPFLDQKFVKMYMKIDGELRLPKKDRMEKYLLRKAFENEDLLPKEVLWRKKEAFSDGISSEDNSWHKLVQGYIDSKVTDEEYKSNKDKYEHCTPTSKEAYYYRKVFCDKFGDRNCRVIPEFWLPRWSGDIKEPSARALDVYKKCKI